MFQISNADLNVTRLAFGFSKFKTQPFEYQEINLKNNVGYFKALFLMLKPIFFDYLKCLIIYKYVSVSML